MRTTRRCGVKRGCGRGALPEGARGAGGPRSKGRKPADSSPCTPLGRAHFKRGHSPFSMRPVSAASHFVRLGPRQLFPTVALTTRRVEKPAFQGDLMRRFRFRRPVRPNPNVPTRAGNYSARGPGASIPTKNPCRVQVANHSPSSSASPELSPATSLAAATALANVPPRTIDSSNAN